MKKKSPTSPPKITWSLGRAGHDWFGYQNGTWTGLHIDKISRLWVSWDKVINLNYPSYHISFCPNADTNNICHLIEAPTLNKAQKLAEWYYAEWLSVNHNFDTQGKTLYPLITRRIIASPLNEFYARIGDNAGKIKCKYCGSIQVVRNGHRGKHHTQYWLCRACKHGFTDNGALGRNSYPEYIINEAVHLRGEGLTYRQISDAIYSKFKVKVGTGATLCNWFRKYI